MRIRHILVPTDFSDGSRAAFDTALDLALDSGARLTLFHVHHVPTSLAPDAIIPVSPELLHDLEHSADLALDQSCDKARAVGIAADHQTSFGTTHTEICSAADQLGVDLIVIGTHGRTGLSHVLLGSVAEKVVRHARCPVLTVRPEMHAAFARP
jgi:nucleotide-binding universal stress UspA family protein